MFKKLKRLLCYFGKHEMVIGVGWSGKKRYDTCTRCPYSIWVEDIEGNKIINEAIKNVAKRKSAGTCS